MVCNRTFVLAIISAVTVMIFSGCGSSTQLGLDFSADQSTSYKSTTEVIKDYRFEQPNLDKLREEQTKNLTVMNFTQTIESIDDKGVATAEITIDALKVEIINKNEVRFSFDSQKEEDKNAPLAKLLGKSYTITISPAGKVSLVDASKAKSAVTSGYERNVVQGILAPEAIVDRHEIAALPKDRPETLSVKQTWSEVVASPPGLLAPKSYEKVYTLASINGDVATVKMQASESGEAVKGQNTVGGMGFFAKMFDNTDDYTGWLKLNTATGKVLEYDETLISTYVAQEMPENGDPEKGPDTLTMGFTNRIHLEMLN